MKKRQHLSNEMLVRFLDDESPAPEVIAVEHHLSGCSTCKQKYSELGGVSRAIENYVSGISPLVAEGERDRLWLLLNTDGNQFARRSKNVAKRWAWGMAVAASLLLGLVLGPALKQFHRNSPKTVQDIQQNGSLLEVDGESFVSLPYSNPDLPVSAHIVQMQVPVSSLAEAGVHFEAISNEVSGSNDSVLADVLLGIDGQPLGVHVLGAQ